MLHKTNTKTNASFGGGQLYDHASNWATVKANGMMCHVFENTNQSATNQFDIQLLYFIEVEVHTVKHTDFSVNKDALFLMFRSKKRPFQASASVKL